jgi:hypothetical protein
MGGRRGRSFFTSGRMLHNTDVYVTPEGGSQVQIGANYAFRLSAPTLNNVTYHAEVSSDEVCSFN